MARTQRPKRRFSRRLLALFGLALGPVLVAAKPAAAEHTFKIHIDYGQADANVFNDDVKQQIEQAAGFLAGYLGGTHEVTVIVRNDNLDGKSGEPGAFATGGPSAWEENTDDKSITKAGGITFNTKSLSDVKSSSIVALTVHELCHVLGFTESSKAFSAHMKGGQFTGAVTEKMNGGAGVPMRGGHFPVSVTDKFGSRPRMSEGGGSFLSCLDLAVLADLGYDVPVLKDKDGPFAVAFVLRPALGSTMKFKDRTGAVVRTATLMQGLAGDDVLIADGGDCLMAGAGGNNVLANGGTGNCDMDGHNTQSGKYGDDGKATFVIRKRSGGDNIRDFDPATDVLLLAPDLGFENADAAAAAIIPKPDEPIPGTNYRRQFKGTFILKLEEGQSLTIVTKDGSKPTAANVKVEAWKEPE